MQNTYFCKKYLTLRASSKDYLKCYHLQLLKVTYKLLNHLIPSQRLEDISQRKRQEEIKGIVAKQQLTPHSFNFAQ